jgi:hypothetical protein
MTISFNNGSSSSCNSAGAKFHINSAGHLIVTYADNTIEDLGQVVGHDGANGTNFYPNLIGFEVPDENFEIDQPIGWTYLSLANGKAILYFKTSAPGVTPATWNQSEFGRGPKGDSGRPFTIDGSGTTLPTDPQILVDEYTFYNTEDGNIYIYDLDTTSWRGPFPFRGPQGLRGRFIIDSQGTDFPSITDLPLDYTFYNTQTGFLYYVEEDSVTHQKQWSPGIEFRGPQGIQGESIKGDPGQNGKDIKVIVNDIDTSYTNALLVIGTCPAGYVVTNIQLDVLQPYEGDVSEMLVRFGGTAQSELDGTVIAPYDYFDIQTQQRYIVDEVNHEPSDKDEIISCIFNESVNNSTTGKIHVIVTIAFQSPIEPISDHI